MLAVIVSRVTFLLASQPELSCRKRIVRTAMLRIYNQVKAKVIFAAKRTLFAIEFALMVQRRIYVQRPNALILPEGHRTINTFMPPDVYKFELKTLTIEICR